MYSTKPSQSRLPGCHLIPAQVQTSTQTLTLHLCLENGTRYESHKVDGCEDEASAVDEEADVAPLVLQQTWFPPLMP